MIDSDSGMSFSGSSTTDYLQKVMNEDRMSSSSSSGTANNSNRHSNRASGMEQGQFGNREDFWGNVKALEPEIFEYRVDIVLDNKEYLPQLIHQIAEEFSCKVKITYYRPKSVVVFEGIEENLLKVESAFDLRMKEIEIRNAEIEVSKLIIPKYKYKSLDIIENDSSLNGTMVVGPFSGAQNLPKLIAQKLNIKLEISKDSPGFFAEKTIKFEAKGNKHFLECFKRIFQHYVVEDQPKKISKMRMK